MKTIDLSELTKGQIRNLAGHDKGAAARKFFNLDELDRDNGQVVVKVPREVYLLSPSFIQGMFSESMRSLGDVDTFFSHYGFDATPLILRQIEDGFDASQVDRSALVKGN